MSDFVYTSPLIRDIIEINGTVEDICETYAGDGPVFLLAREVRLTQNLRITKRPVVIVADLFDGGGHWIDASGEPATVSGANGADGVPLTVTEMYSHDGVPLAG